MSSSEKNDPHKRTKKLNECEIANLDDQDPVILNLSKIGCLEKHYQGKRNKNKRHRINN